LLEKASWITEQFFRKRGRIFPMYHVVKADGAQEAMQAPPLEDKDEAMALMRAYFELFDIKRYVFIDEAWRLDTTDCRNELEMRNLFLCRSLLVPTMGPDGSAYFRI
jgi:hypothetical protein